MSYIKDVHPIIQLWSCIYSSRCIGPIHTTSGQCKQIISIWGVWLNTSLCGLKELGYMSSVWYWSPRIIVQLYTNISLLYHNTLRNHLLQNSQRYKLSKAWDTRILFIILWLHSRPYEVYLWYTCRLSIPIGQRSWRDVGGLKTHQRCSWQSYIHLQSEGIFQTI